MLDVHPPHESIHTWKNFLVHISTIVVGLLIAVGIEQTVEHFHHRHLAHEARKRLLEEVRTNGELAARNAYALHMHETNLRNALQVLGRARSHSLLPQDHVITARSWRPVEVAAWKIARDSGAAGYLTAAEQAAFELANWDAESMNLDNMAATAAIGRAAMVVQMEALDRNAELPAVDRGVYFGDQGEAAAEQALTQRSAGLAEIARLTAPQIERLEQAIDAAIYDDENLLNDCRHLTSQAQEIPKHVLAD